MNSTFKNARLRLIKSVKLGYKKIHKSLLWLGRFIRYILLRLHHHVAHRPHKFLLTKWSWYKKWHDWKYHKHIHIIVLTVYLFFIGLLMLFFYRQAYAADTSQSWSFSDVSDFIFDDNKIETYGSSARLKPQSYELDDNTMALYHLNESAGSEMIDATGINNGIITDGSFVPSVLNNSLEFNGVTSQSLISDSASVSIGQSHTLEAWVKLDSPLSAGSTYQRQTILDKGDYQLYFDNETGRLVYELASASANTWSQVGGDDLNGGWDTNGKRSVSASVKVGSYIYAGLGTDISDAEVWRYDGTSWELIGGGPNSVNGSWSAQTYEYVYSMTTDGSSVYAGLGNGGGEGEIWRWDGSSWSKIGGDSLNGGWTNYVEMIYSLDYFGGYLYAGLGSGSNDAEVWRWDGTSWTQIGGDSLNSGWTTGYESVDSLTNDGANLYAGLGRSAGDGEVWRWDGTSWTKIGGNSLNSSWGNDIEDVWSLRYFSGHLYAGLGSSTGDAEVWRWDGTSWTKIGGDGLNSSWGSGYEYAYSMTDDGANLYTGLGSGNGDGEVWRWDGTSWTQIGGDDINGSWTSSYGDIVYSMIWSEGNLYAGTYDSGGTGRYYSYNGTSWTQIGGNYVNKSWGYYGLGSVQVMQNVGDYLYAGFGSATGAALVWQYNGSNWVCVGGQGINGSWLPDTYEYVLSMANYQSNLVVGLGNTSSTTDNDGEVWLYNGTSWTQIGGDGLNSSWNFTSSHYGEVDSLASYDGYLYAGLGRSSNDGEVWRYDGTSWTQIGGDSLNGGWTNYAENVYSLAIYRGNVVAGLGRSNGDSEIWIWDGTSWSQIGGDGLNNSWSGYATVESIITYKGNLYIGLGVSAGYAIVWRYDGTSWSQIGGDDINNSWTAGTYERVKTMAVYNGTLFAGLGSSSGDGEVWAWDNNNWTKIGGNGLNQGWTTNIEEIGAFSAYKGKFYVGLGTSANSDAEVWAWGNNGFLQSNINSFDDGWHHVAATYDGMNMKLYIDGVLDTSTQLLISVPDSNRDLIIGASYAGREYGKMRGNLKGQLDEIRISDIARESFISKAYSTEKETITLANAAFKTGAKSYASFSATESLNGGSINYQLSNDDGESWLYFDGSSWAATDDLNNANSQSVVNGNINSLPVTFDGLKWRAVLQSDGSQQVSLESVTIEVFDDYTEPSFNASSIAAKKSADGSELTEDSWTNGGSPYFSWDEGVDIGSGIYGYCLYLGQDETADPTTTKGILGQSPVDNGDVCQFITGTNSIDLSQTGILSDNLITSLDPYYLLIRAVDRSGNVYPSSEEFSFKFDNTPPNNPGFISSPSGFINTKEATLTWLTNGSQAANDSASGVAGIQYRINSSQWYGDSHDGSGSMTDLLDNDGFYTTIESPDYGNMLEGANTVYFRTWDNAGNVSTVYVSAALKINTSGAPSEVQNLVVTPASNTVNEFAFSWDPPSSFVGDENNLNYCYVINSHPSASACNYTGEGVTSLPIGHYATQPGTNRIYVATRDESGNINYDTYSAITFEANTAAPGIPSNIDIVDASIKASSKWRVAITWDTPTTNYDSITSYKVYRSTDGDNFSFVGSSSSTTYIDANLNQITYHYYVEACDSTNNCSAESSDVSMLPTGKFTEPANLLDDPTISNITTKRAQINWSTDRASDSKVAIGTASGQYGESEIGNSDQVSVHTINLDNLAAGTTYYYVVKWTDVDGNTGMSQEYTFQTAPAPVIKEVVTSKIGLSEAVIGFTSINATKINLYYGISDAFGGLQTINTSFSESAYNIAISGLDDGTKYYYQIAAIDSEGTEYRGNIFSFTTPQRPRIANLRFQPVENEPTSTQNITWTTNVPSTSTITYGIVGTNGIDIQTSELVTEHEITVSGLEDDSDYFLIAQSRDADGNLAVSEQQTFRTALDTRSPSVYDITVESSVRGSGSEARGQIIISWKTDEPSTSQVGYVEGSNATVFNNKTSEDSQLSTEHIVVVSNLPTSKIYSIQPMSYDKARNLGVGETQTEIIGRASDSVLTIILSSLQRIFGL